MADIEWASTAAERSSSDVTSSHPQARPSSSPHPPASSRTLRTCGVPSSPTRCVRSSRRDEQTAAGPPLFLSDNLAARDHCPPRLPRTPEGLLSPFPLPTSVACETEPSASQSSQSSSASLRLRTDPFECHGSVWTFIVG
ncbi:Hypothetical protein NTJ_01828 [Nesidiocoris tenuis]|uniref:Uncharacterized protein n=1 Tax=Nesidiocoris tenuis TaxID=355587 RepID=A0ABN7ADU0_9HEMI|nr:Hypothetical protein NTJ_01828 [Nesidiocoris tenuis]